MKKGKIEWPEEWVDEPTEEKGKLPLLDIAMVVFALIMCGISVLMMSWVN